MRFPWIPTAIYNALPWVKMLCPRCLSKVKFENSEDGSFRCPNPKCRGEIPLLYVWEHWEYPPVVASAIGYPGHGKTVYFASLFHSFFHPALAANWAAQGFRFCICPLEQKAIEDVWEYVIGLDGGDLPSPNPREFPWPTVVQVEGVPYRKPCSLLLYDTSGEVFESGADIGHFAPFVAKARTALFFIRLSKLQQDPRGMDRLVQVYIEGMANRLESSTKDQDIVVVYTAADEMASYFTGEWKSLQDALDAGSLDHLRDPGYERDMLALSNSLAQFTQDGLGATHFFNTLCNKFKSVQFSLVSALGEAAGKSVRTVTTSSGELKKVFNPPPEPKRVVDPFLWLIRLSRRANWLDRLRELRDL